MWKTLLIVSCACALVAGQLGRQTQSRSQTTSAPVQRRPQPVPSKPSTSFRDTEIVESDPNARPPLSDFVCKEKNERYSMPGSCDKYIECLDGVAEEKQCPDGLRYNPNLNFKAYPCVYPNEYECLERAALQPANPTDECPHQFGFYKLGDSRNCSWFRNCVNGVGYDIECPDGLAFDQTSYRCEWPDEVADCDVEAFLGFRCPEVKSSEEFGPPDGFRFYRSNADCQKYFLCIGTRPRVLRCGGDAAYDELTSTCVSADQVDACPPELKARALRAREEEEEKLAKELEFEAHPSFNKKRL